MRRCLQCDCAEATCAALYQGHLVVVDEIVFDPHVSTPIHAKRKSNTVPVIAKEQDCTICVIIGTADVKLHSLRLYSAKISAQTVDLK